MKKTLSSLLALLLLLSACAKTEPQEIPETEDPNAPPPTDVVPGTEDSPVLDDPPAPEAPSATEPDANTEPVEPIEPTDPSESQKTEKPKTPEADPIVMNVPMEYVQVYEKLKKSQNSGGGYYYGDVVVEEEVMEEAVMDIAPMPEAPLKNMVSDAVAMAPEEPGKVYREDEYSKTNTQVENIDEGDIVKTDGEYIYVLKDSRELLILSAAGEDTEVLSRRDVAESSEDKGDDFYYSSNQYANELYIYDDVLAVVLTCNEWSETWGSKGYSYTSDVRNYVEFYDVSDPTEPIRTGSAGQDGNYSASRMMDGKLYLITTYGIPYNYVREDYDSYIPGLYKNGKHEFMPADCIVYPEELHQNRYTVICSYSMNDGERMKEKAVLGCNGTVYMSGDHLYLASPQYYDDVVDEYDYSVYRVTEYVSGYRTEIIKLDLTGDEIVVEAAGTVDGELLNQFSMDEYNGHLRVVTTFWQNRRTAYKDEEMGFTNWKYSDSGQTNGLYVLDEDMNLVGEISGLAEDERVYSVRFTGDVGYFVTFRQVDPLFSVDLSDPADPKIMGELKIPGFSNYLHPYSETLLFGLGQDADENTGRTTGMKLSMFDISDPYDVIERDKLSIGDGYSEALYNHKAILISASRGIIGFPSQNGYVIYGYSEDGGFTEITRTELDGVWWDGNSRGLYAGDYMYIVLQKCTVVLDMDGFDLVTRVEY